MPVVFDEVVATVEPERRTSEREPREPGRQRRTPAEEIRRTLNVMQQRQLRLKAD